MIERLDVPPRHSRVLWALKDGPLSAREVEAKLRLELLEAWGERNGLDGIEWGVEGRGPNEPVGARILAIASAEDLCLPHVGVGSAHRLLCWLERAGHVERIQLDGHRPMLWRLR